MRNQIRTILQQNLESYSDFRKTLLRPSLRQFVGTIIDQVQQNIRELDEADEGFLSDIGTSGVEAAAAEVLTPLPVQAEIEGLKELLSREVAMSRFFSLVSEKSPREDERIFLKQFADKAKKQAQLIQQRIELETL